MPQGIQDAEMTRGEGRGWEVVRLLHSLSLFPALKVPLTLTCLYFQLSEDIATY